MAREISFQPQEKLLKGFNIVADLLGGTIGPKGLNVFIEDGFTPKISNDGAYISAHTELEDKLENLGAGVVRNASNQTNDDVGDGTTTTAVLLQAIVKECLKRPENPMQIRDSLKESGKKIIEKLKKKAIKIEKKDIEKIAFISSENKELAKMVTEIINSIGEDSAITVEDSKTFESSYEIVEGYEANVGYMSPSFITDKKNAKAIFENVPVLVTEKRISSITDIKRLWDMFAFQTDKSGKVITDQNGKPIARENPITSCVIVCSEIDDAMLGVFINSKNVGFFNCLVIQATNPLIDDIEAAVGAQKVSDSSGVTYQNIELRHLGRAKKIVCDSKKTVFFSESLSAKVYANHLEQMAKQEKNQYTQKKLIERVSKLRGGIGIIRIAAHSDYDREYLKHKADDTIKAVRAALEEGIVEGGGMTLWRLAQEIKPKTIGEEILKKSLTSPLKKIIENSGKEYAEIISNMPNGMGYDAKNDKMVEMYHAGIIDPLKVERCSLENAISAAATFITVFASNTEYVKPNNN